MTRTTRFHRLIGAFVLASTVASGLALGHAEASASAADSRCVAPISMVALPEGQVFQVPASIDGTGQTDVSEALQGWFASTVRSGSVDRPNVVRFPQGARYLMSKSLLLAKRGNFGIPGAMYPNLPVFKLENVVVDFNGSTIEQLLTVPFLDGTGDLHNRFGNPMVFTVGSSGIELRNGHLVGSDPTGKWDADRFNWPAITISGDPSDDWTERVWVHDMQIEDVWGDFVMIQADANVLHRVVIEDNTMRTSGRQGIVVNGGTDVTVRHNGLFDVGRLVIDSEPAMLDGFSNVVFQANYGDPGPIGYAQISLPANGTLAERIGFLDNTVTNGNLRIEIQGSPDVVRSCAVVTGNQNLGSSLYRPSVTSPFLIKVGRWQNVTVRNNFDRAYPLKGIRAINTDLATDVDSGANCMRGATDDTCPTPDTTAPSVPVPSVTSKTAATVCLTWPASTDNDLVAYYTVLRNGTNLGTVTGTQYCEPAQTLSPLTSYQYSVQATDNSGNTSTTGTVSVTTLADTQAPTVPTGVQTEILTAGSAKISWTCSTDDVKGVKYRVTINATTTTTSYCQITITNLVPGSTQQVTVRAVDTSNNTSALSTPVTLTMPYDTTAPTQVPTVTAGAASTTSITLKWGTATDDVKVANYLITYDGQTPVSVGASVRQYSHKNLTPGTNHTYTVVAIDTSGNRSIVSTTATATTPTI